MIKTAQDIKSYKKQLKEALSDQFLRTALDNFNCAYRENRSAVYEGIDFEGIKKEIAAEKDAALPRLIELFETFKTHAEAAGAIVFCGPGFLYDFLQRQQALSFQLGVVARAL